MSQFDPPRPPNLPPEQDAFASEMMPTGPTPMSGMAVAGFVSSVIFCCPVLSPLLGLIFSLVGLAQTKGGVRRGRGLAIAGLVIAILVVALQGWGIPTVAGLVRGWSGIVLAASAFQTGDVEAGISAWYGMASPDLKSAVTENEFAEWINAEFVKHGGLQSLQLDPNRQIHPSSDVRRFRLRWQGQFPSETVVIHTDISIRSWAHVYLEDVVIGEAKLIGSTGIDEADSDPDAQGTDAEDAPGEQ